MDTTEHWNSEVLKEKDMQVAGMTRERNPS